MSVAFTPVGWNRAKIVYDAVLIAGVLGYLAAFRGAGAVWPTPLDAQSQSIKAFGSCAFLLLTLVLAIGPLARLDPRFLPLLYNRRHFGVITAAVATAHAAEVLGWYFAFSPIPAGQALLVAEAGTGAWRGLPFIPFGMAALAILWLLAVTSHDFWLAFLTPPLWKRLHMAVYAAYALIVAHIAFGALQDARQPGLALAVTGSAALLVTLHLAAWRRQGGRMAAPGDWVPATTIGAVAEGRGVVVRLADGAAVAIFRQGTRLYALSNRCAHQNGPLGEGRVRDGCATCPWHGHQFRLEDGCAPAPFTDRVATYRLKRDGDRVLIDPRPNPLGTVQPSLELEAGQA